MTVAVPGPGQMSIGMPTRTRTAPMSALAQPRTAGGEGSGVLAGAAVFMGSSYHVRESPNPRILDVQWRA